MTLRKGLIEVKRADGGRGMMRQAARARDLCGSLEHSPSLSSFTRAILVEREFAVILNVNGKCASVQSAIKKRITSNYRV